MRNRMTRFVAAATLAVLATSLIGSAASAAPKTRWVDDDGKAGPNGCNGGATASKTIQGAINAAGPGDTIQVCPGTYEEMLRIRGNRKGLTVKSVQPWKAIIRTPKQMPRPYFFAALITIDKVDDVTIQGFRTKVRTRGTCDDIDFLVAAAASQGTVIRGNRFLTDLTPDADCGVRVGVIHGDRAFDGSARRSSATISNNIIRDTVEEGVVAFSEAGRQVRTRVHDNSIRAYGACTCLPAAAASRARSAWGPARPRVSGLGTVGVSGVSMDGIGVLVDGAVSGKIDQNVIQGAPGGLETGASWGAGILVTPSYAPAAAGVAPADRLVIAGNLIRRAWGGILIDGGDGVQVRANTIRTVLIGLAVVDLVNSVIRNNTVQAKGAGILVLGEDNRFTRNTVTGAGGICIDDSSGSGTEGTANTWTHNTASQGSSPEGICQTPRR
ncbi:MAG: right-handed parallel beta-helix repeat-containing protein [Chloroflexi bacterium]|nr:right-handed parallel beta-helix repeat-containing protein [Chloroflexota bacterium]